MEKEIEIIDDVYVVVGYENGDIKKPILRKELEKKDGLTRLSKQKYNLNLEKI